MSINIKDAGIKEVMTELLSNQQLSFSIEEKMIVITEKVLVKKRFVIEELNPPVTGVVRRPRWAADCWG